MKVWAIILLIFFILALVLAGMFRLIKIIDIIVILGGLLTVLLGIYLASRRAPTLKPPTALELEKMKRRYKDDDSIFKTDQK